MNGTGSRASLPFAPGEVETHTILWLPGIDDVARQGTGCKQQNIDADVLAMLGVEMCHAFRRCGNAPEAVFVDGQIEIGAPAPPLDLNKGHHAAAPRHNIDFPARSFNSPVQNCPTLGAQPQRRARLSFAPASLCLLTPHRALISIARS